MKDSIQITLRQTRGQTFQNQRLNAGLLKSSDNVQAMLRNDTAFKFLKNVRGSPAYWNTVLLDLLAMVRQLGIPTWFLTLSAADMQWPEIIRSIAHQYGKHVTDEDVRSMSWEEKSLWLRSNPVTAARQFQHRLDSFFKEYIGAKANPIGKLKDYMIRIEFQARGSPHAHIILWIEGAPRLDVDSDQVVAAFIDQYQKCSIPQQEGKLRDLVLKLQKHSHSVTCRKRRNPIQQPTCRFHFPHAPSSETLIARPLEEPDLVLKTQRLDLKREILNKVKKVLEDEDLPENISLDSLLDKAGVTSQQYQTALSIMQTGTQIFLKREPAERLINQYNPNILQVWKANMDLQYIVDPYSCIMYITSYMLKSERAMSELLKKVADDCTDADIRSKLKKVGTAFLGKREVSIQEAAYRLCSIPLKKASRKVVFVNTAPKDKRTSLLKPQSLLQAMDDNDENIFCTSPMDRYAARPQDLQNMCMAEFAATYTTGPQEDPDAQDDHIPDVLDGSDDDEAHGNEDGQRDTRPTSTIKLQKGLGHMRKRRRHCVIRCVHYIP